MRDEVLGSGVWDFGDMEIGEREWRVEGCGIGERRASEEL